MTRVALLGTRAFGCAALDLIHKHCELALVCGDEKVLERARHHRIEQLAVHQDRTDLAEWINAVGAHVVIAAHWTRFVPQDVREATKCGVIAIHPSLLPRWRGIAAVQWQALNDDPIVGSTAYQMDDGLDTGPVLAQKWAHSAPGTTASELWRDTLFPLGLEVLEEALQKIERSVYTGVPLPLKPQDHRFQTEAPKLYGMEV